ncbi:FdhF/YdeP family oxidoreductase [Aureispira anguillae]|uniref:FdhF/YdeP family oxidoreductase n=1 Tax=Aureispira anguillae TaxID=2864201 RepID=A0A915YG88_9BACT|nr:FdhF/YdeP family oxidoreductase [Aureispira anguillae]BDS12583.1 FdhF/YdeP family oxidoreductase [Aureispira anguillae]
MKRNVRIVPPENFEDLKLTARKKKAAGIPALVSSLQHLKKEIGVWQGIKRLNKMNQKGGFDCAGCAWPDPDGKRSSLGEYCENGVKALAEETTLKRVTPAFFAAHSVEEMSNWTDYKIGKSGRITAPMYLAADRSHYEPISWDKAFEIIAQHLQALSSPNEAVFYTSGRTSNEAAFMYQLLARQLGTNNLPDCSNMCHESSGKGLGETLGIGKGSVTLEDIHQAEVVVVIGQNPGTNHPRMLTALAKCKKNGGKVVSINPIPEPGLECFVNPQSVSDVLTGGTSIADQYLQVRINGDVALLKAAMILMLEAEEKQPGTVFDLPFLEEHCEGYEALIADLKQVDFLDAVAESGVSESEIRQFAALLIQKKKIIICWAMGITQHENGVQNIREIVNILLLKGSIGKVGAGTCPVRGHSNVQGDRTVGIWEAPPELFLSNLDKEFNIQSPRAHGYDVVHAIHAMHQNAVKVFIAMGGNFISATPDSQLTGEAIQNCDLTVQISTKLNRSHLVTGKEALILPCLSRAEEDIQSSGRQFVTVENSMGVVHQSQGSFEPASPHLKSEPAIVTGIAQATFGSSSTVNWSQMIDNYDTIRNHIETVIGGFENYNQRVRQPEGFYLPNCARDRKFNTPSKKAQLTINPIPKRTVKPGHFIMMTIRTHDQYNTTIYGLDDRYRGILNERRVALMNQEDMKTLGLQNKDIIHFISHYKGEQRTAKNFKVIAYDIAKGCIGTYFPETNALVHIDNIAKKSNTPASKFIEVEIIKT